MELTTASMPTIPLLHLSSGMSSPRRMTMSRHSRRERLPFGSATSSQHSQPFLSLRRSVTGCLHMINKTPIDWFSKLQSTVETSTFGSEYIAARTCTEQIIDLRNTLRYLGVPVKGELFMFGNNKSVVNTASTPHAKLMKWHNMLSYHKTREAIAARITHFHHVRGKQNLADILSKHWNMPSVWDMLRPLLFWRFQPLQDDKTTKDVEEDESCAHQGE
jgi:hypothetical protein